MWTVIGFLIITFSCANAFADDIVSGRILSIDRNSGTVAIEVLDSSKKLQPNAGTSSFTRNGFGTDASAPVIIHLNKNALPENIRKNTIIKIQGQFQNNGQFNPRRLYYPDTPRHLQKARKQPKNDMTGVRQRIWRGGRPDEMPSYPERYDIKDSRPGDNGDSHYRGKGSRGGRGGR